MKFLHSMLRITDIDESLHFFCDLLGLEEARRKEVESGEYTLIFLKAPGDDEERVELTYNWEPE